MDPTGTFVYIIHVDFFTCGGNDCSAPDVFLWRWCNPVKERYHELSGKLWKTNEKHASYFWGNELLQHMSFFGSRCSRGRPPDAEYTP